jgi:hypothetical protein
VEMADIYTIRSYIPIDDGLDVDIKEQTSKSIEFALKLWLLEWCKEPYMSEIVSTKKQITKLLAWVVNHERDFYLIGTSTTNDAQKIMFEISKDELIREIRKSLADNDIMETGDGGYTAKPFTLSLD